MERRDRFILLRSTCTVKMQSRLARQRIHQHTRAHETAVPSLPWDLDVEAEGVVYPVLPLRYQLAPILSTKGSTFLIDKDGRDISTRRICRNDVEAKKNATSVGVRIKREKRKQEEAGKVTGLKLLYISVPPYSFRGQSALLECRYDLEADKLYSITWYKDHEEFYRYVPRGEPTKHSYRVEGVKVDHRKSNDKEVLLQDVSLHSSGRYKCEVSAEAPSFNSVSAEASMEVAGETRHGNGVRAARTLFRDIQFTTAIGTGSHRRRQNKRQMRGDRGIGLDVGQATLRDAHNGSFRGRTGQPCNAFRVPDSSQRATSPTTANLGLGIRACEPQAAGRVRVRETRLPRAPLDSIEQERREDEKHKDGGRKRRMGDRT
ncbi:uncharacterized protein [Bombus flavifrons]|uniref:uncharacterized protein isoform X1 n=1 Tax=Bombus flavifrons TaxID=103934 RepID=UPI00370496DD